MTAYNTQSEPVSPLRSYLELLRLPNVFTALADALMGFFFVRAAWAVDDELQTFLPIGLWAAGLLAAASAALYSAGMVLNDVFDVELDREEQPDRPLPSGRVSLRSAQWLGWQLLSVGVLLAVGVAVMLQQFPPAHTDHPLVAWLPALIAAALALLVVLYNAGLKRTPLGPLAMGGCRALNVLLGMSVLRDGFGITHAAVAGGIGVYIAGVTWFARGDARRSDRRQLLAATVVMVAGVGLIGALPWLGKDLWMLQPPFAELWRWYTMIAVLAGFVVVRAVSAVIDPSSESVRASVRRSITALVFLDATACYAAAGPVYACIVAVLVIPVTAVGRWVDRG